MEACSGTLRMDGTMHGGFYVSVMLYAGWPGNSND